MRFPTVFPTGVHSPGEFLRRHMPNLYELWRHGVRFERYYSAGNACSPRARRSRPGCIPSGVAPGHADGSRAGVAARVSHLRQAAQGARIRDAVHRQVASVQPAGGRQRRRLPRQLRIYRADQPGSDWHQRPGRRQRRQHRRPSGAVAATQQQGGVALLPDGQLRQSPRQAVLLGRLRGRPLLPDVRRQVLHAVHRAVQPGA